MVCLKSLVSTTCRRLGDAAIVKRYGCDLGETLAQHGSSVQSTVALSSGGWGYYLLLRASTHALGIKELLDDWCYVIGMEIPMRCDGSTAQSIASRQGLGRMRQVDVRFLWLQEDIQNDKLRATSIALRRIALMCSQSPCRKLML